MSRNREVTDLVATLEAQGFRVVRRKRHWMVYARSGNGMVTMPISPSDVRSMKNTKAQLRRIGWRP